MSDILFQAITDAEGKRHGFGRHSVIVVPNYRLRLSDGVHIAMRVWFPCDTTNNTCFEGCESFLQYDSSNPATFEAQPVIMEYLPYRKSDHTLLRDHERHLWWSSHGYVCVRVDMRGSGDSEGLYFDEYTSQEVEDGAEVINWLAKQAWCNGKVGMYGKSWGGFNGLIMAYHQPQPLKVTFNSTLKMLLENVTPC